MRLKYKILWVENDSDWAESIEEEIKELVEQQYGFDYDRTFSSKQNDDILFNDYDLILMDLNLESEPTGDVLIKNIREREIYTDVIFYSADGLQKIKQKAHDLDLEGVYFASRDKDLFINKVNSVIMTTIHKVQDLNNLRGLVMAEVSELDVLMEQIILAYFNSPERMRTFHDHITANREETWHKMLNSSTQCDKQCVHIWREKDLSEYVSKLDSSQKARAINIVLADIDSAHTICTDTKFFKNYDDSIILNRNNLAHCISIKDKSGNEILKTWKGEKIYNEDEFRNMRANIIKYHNMFTTLLTTLTASA